MPPNPSKAEDLLSWNGKRGLEWGVTQCTDFFLICLRALKTGAADQGFVRWFSADDSGEIWYKEMTRVALELIRSDIVARQAAGKKSTSREHHIFDLRRVMSLHAATLKARPRVLLVPGRALPPPPALKSVKAAPQGDLAARNVQTPKIDSNDALRFKADLAGAIPFPTSSIASARARAEGTGREQREAFKVILEDHFGSSNVAIPDGIDLPSEFFNPEDSVFTPKGDFIPTDSDHYVSDFAIAFARAPVWEKAMLWEDYLGMEIARIDSQMILMLGRKQELEAMRQKAESDYQRWLVQRQALEESYRQAASTTQKIADLKAKTGLSAPRGSIAPQTGNPFMPPQRFQQQRLQSVPPPPPPPVRAQSVGAWSKRSEAPTGSYQAYSEADSAVDSPVPNWSTSQMDLPGERGERGERRERPRVEGDYSVLPSGRHQWPL
jgi:hypothetical protein